MKIGEVARRLNTSTRTLRFYEEEGLISAPRSDKGTRYYREEDVQRFEAILMLTRLGIPLETLVQLAQARPQSHSGDEASHKVDALLTTLENTLEQQRHQLEQASADLMRARGLVRQCFGCERSPTRKECADCSVAQYLDRAQVLQLIWDQDHG